MIGELIHTRDRSNHGCREGFSARIVSIDLTTINAEIISNTHCGSCWQTGCTNPDPDNDCVGELVTINLEDIEVDRYGQITC